MSSTANPKGPPPLPPPISNISARHAIFIHTILSLLPLSLTLRYNICIHLKRPYHNCKPCSGLYMFCTVVKGAVGNRWHVICVIYLNVQSLLTRHCSSQICITNCNALKFSKPSCRFFFFFFFFTAVTETMMDSRPMVDHSKRVVIKTIETRDGHVSPRPRAAIRSLSRLIAHQLTDNTIHIVTCVDHSHRPVLSLFR